MIKRTLVMVAVLVVLTLISPFHAAAQARYATYVSADGTFGFVYPATWDQTLDPAYGTVDLAFDENVLFIYPPATVSSWGYTTESAAALLKLLAPDWNLHATDVQPFDNGALVFRETEDDTGGTYYNLLLAAQADADSFVLVDAYIYNDDFGHHVEELALLLASMEASANGGVAGKLDPVVALNPTVDNMREVLERAVPGEAAAPEDAQPGDVALRDYDAAWPQVVAALHDAAWIPAGGSLLFFEDYAFSTGQGDFFTPLSEQTPRTDFVFSAQLHYAPSESPQDETCALALRVAGDARTEVGYASGDTLYYLDTPDGDAPESDQFVPDDLYLDEPHTVTVIAVGEKLSVLVDGVVTFDAVAVEARAGSWGLALAGQGTGALCEASNLWVYTLE